MAGRPTPPGTARVRHLGGVLAGLLLAVLLFQFGAVVALLVTVGIPLGASPGPPGLAYFALNLGFALLAAAVAGWVAARVARTRVRSTALVLAATLAVLALWGFSKPASQWPGWYPPVLALVAVTGVFLGAVWRERRARP